MLAPRVAARVLQAVLRLGVPAVGAIMQFRIVSQVQSVDDPTVPDRRPTPIQSQVPAVLTEQIPIVTPVRTRVVDSAARRMAIRASRNGQCTPDCPENMPFPWTIRVNGGQAHSMNANRISMLIPKPGEIEHWTYVNGGGGWDHPIHLHFEEGITMNRGRRTDPGDREAGAQGRLAAASRRAGQFQVQFGEYGGSYVNHCHNTVHEDFALLMRIQLLNGVAGTPQGVTATPNPNPAA